MYKYAIIGFGGLGKLHLTNLLQLEQERGDFHLQAICGADPESFKESVKLNLGTVDLSEIDISDCHFYQDYKELIDTEKPDFILSTLPTFLHEERRNPSLSASKIAIRDTSGISSPSLKRLIPTRTSYLPFLNSYMICVLSKVFVSL